MEWLETFCKKYDLEKGKVMKILAVILMALAAVLGGCSGLFQKLGPDSPLEEHIEEQIEEQFGVNIDFSAESPEACDGVEAE